MHLRLDDPEDGNAAMMLDHCGNEDEQEKGADLLHLSTPSFSLVSYAKRCP